MGQAYRLILPHLIFFVIQPFRCLRCIPGTLFPFHGGWLKQTGKGHSIVGRTHRLRNILVVRGTSNSFGVLYSILFARRTRKRTTWVLPRPTGQFTVRKRRPGGDFVGPADKKNRIEYTKTVARPTNDENVAQTMRPPDDAMAHTSLFQPTSMEGEERTGDASQAPERLDDEKNEVR